MRRFVQCGAGEFVATSTDAALDIRFARRHPRTSVIAATAAWTGLFLKLVVGDWIAARDNLMICGPTGVGKIMAGLRPVAKGVP